MNKKDLLQDKNKDLKININDVVNEIFSLYELYGDNDYIGEEISQVEHMLQTANQCELNNDKLELIFASLFHDIGHLLALKNKNLKQDNFGCLNHEKIGSDYLKDLFISNSIIINSDIYNLIEYHVKAKKYLAFKNKKYIDKLSNASKQTLIQQGGIMTQEEADVFEKNRLFIESIKIRKYDENAKYKNIKTKTLNYYKKKFLEYIYKLNKIE